MTAEAQSQQRCVRRVLKGTERRARILEMTFWEAVNNDYKLWLKPRIALRKGFVVVQMPYDAFELRESGQT